MCVYVTKLREKKKRRKKKMIICGAAGGRGQTDQLVLVIHDFSIKLDCRHVFFVLFLYLKKKEKRRDGMSRGVLPFYSLTL